MKINNRFVILTKSAVCYWMVVLCLPFTIAGCFGEQGILNRREKQYVDSVTLVETKIIKDRLDSICDTDFDKNVDLAVDSILNQRVQEIKAILEK